MGELSSDRLEENVLGTGLKACACDTSDLALYSFLATKAYRQDLFSANSNQYSLVISGIMANTK